MENRYMGKRKKLIAAFILTGLGLVLGVYWNSEKFCIGDELFSAWGLPIWSNGTTGTHYPAIAGIVLILIGTTLFNLAVTEKVRRWTWGIVIAVFVLLNFVTALS